MAVDPDTLIDAALRELPAPRAPHTLLPRVMRAVAVCTRRPWYQRAWLTWPLGWQLVSGGAVAAVCAAMLFVPELLQAVASLPPDRAAGTAGTVQQVLRAAREIAAASDALRIVYRLIVLPGVLYAGVVLALTGAACAASMATLSMLTFGRTSQR